MPRYYFHLQNEQDLDMDDEGIELHDDEEAIGTAVDTAQRLRRGLLYRVDARNPWKIYIANETGHLLRDVSF
ncbi:DUF6894 family protein [Microvirga pudoricolor]|uniref:DUF6894 family protein n=1 Tax=Microvirga pudoricolor TaxID=2778729 RepID=UPI0019523FB3|nr:hypothetical protein [Microvirga pudoricolor]MBM6595993.1 hypothetical protein [Microvirga pudoricolor]